jgi:hypothetical protein
MGLIADPSFLSSAAWTFMFWQQNPGNGVWWFRLYNIGLDSGSGVLNVAGTLRLRIKTAAGANVEVSTAPPPADDEWVHYAGTYDGNVGRFYIDGALIGTTSSVPSPAAIDRIDIAEHTVANFAMDDVRVYDEALDEATINLLMATSPPDSVGVTGALDPVLSGPALAMVATASATGTMTPVLSSSALSLVGTARATAELALGLGSPSLALSGVASAQGVLGLGLGHPVLSLHETLSNARPIVGPPGTGTPLAVGGPTKVPIVLAGSPRYG